MNKLILCEGATDAILLSYYLERTAGWKFFREPPQGVPLSAEQQLYIVGMLMRWMREQMENRVESG